MSFADTQASRECGADSGVVALGEIDDDPERACVSTRMKGHSSRSGGLIEQPLQQGVGRRARADAGDGYRRIDEQGRMSVIGRAAGVARHAVDVAALAEDEHVAQPQGGRAGTNAAQAARVEHGIAPALERDAGLEQLGDRPCPVYCRRLMIEQNRGNYHQVSSAAVDSFQKACFHYYEW